jgi:epsilon-lactone hydrolase
MVSQQQRETVIELLRNSPLDLGGDALVQRAALEQMLSSQPVPDDVVTAPSALGRVPTLFVDIADTETQGVILFLHGGGYALGSAAASVALASDLVRRTAMRVASVDYRLAPEHPFPAALDDALDAYRALLAGGVDASRVAVVGESAGGGLAVALLAALRAADLPQPACAAVFSPWVDLGVTGGSFASKRAVDPAITAEALRVRARCYAGSASLDDPRLSPIHADLTGLPPLLVQVGSYEVLLDDAVRLAARAAADDVAVILDVTPGVPHVFQFFAALLDEGDAALARASTFLRTHTGI